jgi:hypothetical protein
MCSLFVSPDREVYVPTCDLVNIFVGKLLAEWIRAAGIAAEEMGHSRKKLRYNSGD